MVFCPRCTNTHNNKLDGELLVRAIHYAIERKNTEGALRESQEKFRALVETTSDWIWEVDQKGIYTYVSPRAKDLLGYAPEEVLGKTPFDLMPFDEVERVSGLFQDIVDSGKPYFSIDYSIDFDAYINTTVYYNKCIFST